MALLLDEHKLVEDNIFEYENRIANSEIVRFIESTPVFTTYFHINNNESTVDDGYKDIESIIGIKSPLRYQKITEFPIYNIEGITLALEESEYGLDSSYSGEGTVLPNTIKPLPNDFFMINHLDKQYLFRITDIGYDNIRPDGYYKIGFKLEYLDDVRVESLLKQVNESFSCILENIGTEAKCIISDEYLETVSKIDAMYNDMIQTYITIFYNKVYNSFLGDHDGNMKVYDPFMAMFINKHKLLNRKNDYSTIFLSDTFNDNKRQIKYEKTIYRAFERRDVKLVNPFPYHLIGGITKHDSPFARWNDKSVLIVDIPLLGEECEESYITQELTNSFKFNAPTESIYVELMQKFIRNEEMSIYDIPLNLNEVLLSLNASEEVYFFTPILLYIIKEITTHFLQNR